MFCPKCGAQNPDDSQFCSKCGAGLVQAAAPAPPPAAAPVAAGARTSGMAIAALVMGIISIFINPLAILAIIFGGIGISQTGKDPTLKGKGMAVAGLAIGIVIAIFWFLSMFWWSAWWWMW